MENLRSLEPQAKISHSYIKKKSVFLCCNIACLILSQLGDPSDFIFEVSMRLADFTAVPALKLACGLYGALFLCSTLYTPFF